MAAKELPPLDLLRQLLRYDSETGKLYWLPRKPSMFHDGAQGKEHVCNRWNSLFAGKEAGCKNGLYNRIRINNHEYKSHRIIYALSVGEQLCSDIQIDHSNRIKLDNRIINLRKATTSQNRFNVGVKVNNTSGTTGVSWYKPYGKWRARIKVDNKEINLGYYSAFEDAVIARQNAETEYYGQFRKLP